MVNIPQIFPTAVFQAGFGQEAHYGSGYLTGSTIGVLGVAMKLSNLKFNNDYEVLYDLGSRVGATAYVQGIKVDTTAEFVLAADNKEWLGLLLNKSNSTTPYWTVPPLTGQLPSGYCMIEDQLQHYYELTGLMADSCDLKFTEGKTVDVTLEFKGKNVVYLSTTAPADFTPSTFYTYPSEFLTWAAVQITYNGNYGSTTFSVQPVKSFDIKINNNNKPFYGLGNIDYIAFVPTKLDISGSIEILHDSNMLEHFTRTIESQTSTASYDITLTIGSGEYSAYYTIVLEGLFWNEGSMTLEPVDPVVDKLDFKSLNIKIQ
jgi:hypothetical protein